MSQRISIRVDYNFYKCSVPSYFKWTYELPETWKYNGKDTAFGDLSKIKFKHSDYLSGSAEQYDIAQKSVSRLMSQLKNDKVIRNFKII